jgi:hypothetical protein
VTFNKTTGLLEKLDGTGQSHAGRTADPEFLESRHR